MQITVEISEEVAATAKATGVSPEAFVQKAAERAAHLKSGVLWESIGPGPLTPEEAGIDMLDLSKGLRLDGLKIKDLVHDGHRY